MKYLRLLILSGFLGYTLSCDSSISGSFKENQPPSTYLTVNEINTSDRLSSQVDISWWGLDPDGFVAYYEYAINDTSEGAWTRINRTDSTFILPIVDSDSADVLFKIRAVDNEDLRDPSGAELIYPILNSDPQVQLTSTPPDTSYAFSSFEWAFSDPDGFSNLDRIEIAVNDTTNGWRPLPVDLQNTDETILLSIGVDNTSLGEKTAETFVGRSYQPLSLQLEGVKIDTVNKFYVRVVDKAGSASNVDSTRWYIKQRTSNVLFLNDYEVGSEEALDLHLQLLSDNGVQPDVLTINDGNTEFGRNVTLSEAFPVVIETLRKNLAEWDHIYWISDKMSRNIVYAQNITTEFFDNGGNMFINIKLGGVSGTEDVFSFLPIDSLGAVVPPFQSFRINSGDTVKSDLPGYPDLVTNSRVTSIIPQKALAGGELYSAPFKKVDVFGASVDHDGFSGVSVESPEGNLIFFGVDFQDLDDNQSLVQLVNKLCVERLGFTQ